MNTPDHDQPPVSQEEFAAFLRGLSLQSLRVSELRVDAKRDFAHGEMQQLQHHESFKYELVEEELLRIDAHHTLSLLGARKKKLGAVIVTFSWYYLTKRAPTEGIFKVFAPMVKFQTWPHLREVLQSVAARANWPRITLPLLVAQKPGPEDEAHPDRAARSAGSSAPRTAAPKE